MTDSTPATAARWEPPCDPRRPEPGMSWPTTYQGWIALWVAAWFFAFCLLLPLVIATIGLVKTWNGGTWNP